MPGQAVGPAPQGARGQFRVDHTEDVPQDGGDSGERKKGLDAASAQLRHGSKAITERYYVDDPEDVEDRTDALQMDWAEESTDDDIAVKPQSRP
jgi:hypothetical protein